MKLNITNKMATMAFALMGMGVVTSCTDTWDGHYQEEVHGDGTLWQAIVKDANLSNFAKLVQAVDMQKDLDGSQMFTVFAPTNDVFSSAYCDELIESYKQQKANGVKAENNTVIKEFVQNHIALYNYSISSVTDETIVMMNGKYQQMSNKGLGGATYKQANCLAQNGVLFTVGDLVPYTPNIYESLAKDEEFSEVSNFIHSYDVNKFYPSLSVPGEIINGQTHYLDSVTRLTNVMFSMLGRINSEDSTYYMVIPTNNVWNAELEKNQKYFMYDKTVEIKDSLEYLFPRLQVLEGSLFSLNVNYDEDLCRSQWTSSNAYLLDAGKKYAAVKPTGGWKYYYHPVSYKENLTEILFGWREQTECSNGIVFKESEEWPFSDALLNASTIEMEGETIATLDSVYTQSTSPLGYVSVSSDNPFYDQVSRHMYIEIAPKAAAHQKALFNIYNVLSNVEYEVYVVTVPTLAGDTLATPLQNNFRATVYYNDENGDQQHFKAVDNLETSGTAVDSLFVGTYTFPTSSYGLDKAQVKVLLEDRTSSSKVKNGTHTMTMSVDQFVFKPIIKRED